MRFMILVRGNARSESGALPDEDRAAAMAAFHEQLARAGVLLDANALQPSSTGWRIAYSQGSQQIFDGPSAGPEALIAGYTLIQVRSHEEALEWARRCPAPFAGIDCEIELRPLSESPGTGARRAADR